MMKSIFVKDVRNKITSPLIIWENEKLDKIAEKFLSSPINRTIYIIDEEKRFKGYININRFMKIILLDLVEPSFYKDMLEDAYFLGKIGYAQTAKDIMNKEDIGVKDEDNLQKVVSIMKNYSLQELPVLDNENRVIGDINIHEIILGWKMRSEK